MRSAAAAGSRAALGEQRHARFSYASDRSQGGQRLIVTDDARPQFEREGVAEMERTFRD